MMSVATEPPRCVWSSARPSSNTPSSLCRPCVTPGRFSEDVLAARVRLAAEAHELDERLEATAVFAGNARRHLRRTEPREVVRSSRSPAEDHNVAGAGQRGARDDHPGTSGLAHRVCEVLARRVV